jgi:hypothetical protein
MGAVLSASNPAEGRLLCSPNADDRLVERGPTF